MNATNRNPHPAATDVFQYLTEMRAMGSTFYVIADEPLPGILTMFPLRPTAKEAKRAYELEQWQWANVTKEELKQAILATPADPGQPHNLASAA
ncbi:MAG: hypothetical protein ABIS49_13995 [Aestuariivirga sp.]